MCVPHSLSEIGSDFVTPLYSLANALTLQEDLLLTFAWSEIIVRIHFSNLSPKFHKLQIMSVLSEYSTLCIIGKMKKHNIGARGQLVVYLEASMLL